MEPNKERLRLWADALRNPELVQGHGQLAWRPGPDEPWRQCCLDVMCQVAIAHGLPLHEEVIEGDTNLRGDRGEGRRYYMDGYVPSGEELEDDEKSTLLPIRPVLGWYGLRGERNVTLGLHGETSASDLNDSCRYGFSQIADAVEEYFGL